MPDEKTGVPKETAVNESRSDGSKPAAGAAAGAPAKRPFQRIIPWLLLLLAAGILFASIGGWNRWVGGGGAQKTDDAYLRSDITPLGTKVSGTVQFVAVADYQRVKAGDLLVQLKDDDFKAHVVQTEAEVAAAHAALENNAKQKRSEEHTSELQSLRHLVCRLLLEKKKKKKKQ